MSSTSSLVPLSLEDWPASLQTVVEDMNGRPLNVHALLANHPALLEAWWQFRNYVVSGGELGKRNAELVILRTALHNRCWYEWASHVDRGMANGLSFDEIQRIPDAADPAWSPSDRLILDCVDELEFERRLSPVTLDRAAADLSSAQLLDLMAVHSTYSMLARVLNTWPVELDAQVAAALPAAATAADFATLSCKD